jgi:hypothetical protein
MSEVGTAAASRASLYATRPQILAFVTFGLLPFTILLGTTFAAYALLLMVVASTLRVRNVLILTIVAAGCVFYVGRGPYADNPGTIEYLNAINTTIGVLLLVLSPWIRLDVRLQASVPTDLAMLAYMAIAAVLMALRPDMNAVIQIGSFTFALYFATSRGALRRIVTAAAVVVAGGRAIMVGAVYGWLMAFRLRLHAVLSTPVFLAIVVLTATGLIFTYLQDLLVLLQARDIQMKGRTAYWLTLLGLDPTLLGAGAGAAVAQLTTLTEVFRLPHNDYLRAYVDYGTVIFLATVFALWRNSLRGPVPLFASAVLALYMLTGNPLSFATVIVAYILALGSAAGDSSRPRRWKVVVEYPARSQASRVGGS